jgi:hypothetical protein
MCPGFGRWKRPFPTVVDSELEVGTECVAGEELFPASGGQLLDSTVGMDTDALQHVHEIRIRMDAVEAAGRGEAVENGQALGSDLSPTEVPKISTDRNGSDLALEMIGIDL